MYATIAIATQFDEVDEKWVVTGHLSYQDVSSRTQGYDGRTLLTVLRGARRRFETVAES